MAIKNGGLVGRVLGGLAEKDVEERMRENEAKKKKMGEIQKYFHPPRQWIPPFNLGAFQFFFLVRVLASTLVDANNLIKYR
jgi:hypothetical protein